ncbi:hypothetical protein AAG570_010641 [Ranatra chinensis]|uniref:Uncharacterized protein n=1 Tax=Ranatra chinensis TaxID=642074 RepID=A0ABD0ZBG0_9HEMI
MASKRQNMFYQNKKQETTEIGYSLTGRSTNPLNVPVDAFRPNLKHPVCLKPKLFPYPGEEEAPGAISRDPAQGEASMMNPKLVFPKDLQSRISRVILPYQKIESGRKRPQGKL